MGAELDIITEMTYEAQFNQVQTSKEPRGFITTYRFDYEEATAGDLNGDGIVNQANGNLVRIEHPVINAGQPGPQVIQEKFWYNGFGQVTRSIDGEGFPDTFDYFAAGPSTGYLQKMTVAFGSLNLVTEYTTDTVGNVLTVKNPRLFTTTYSVNQLNQVVRVTPPAPFASHLVDYFFDANDNIDHVDTAWIDEAGAPYAGSPLTTSYAYSLLNDVTGVTQEVGPGTITTSYALDNNQNVTDITFPQLNVTHVVFDERDLVYQTTRGFGTADASTEERTFDGNRNLTVLKDGELHTDTTNTYDGFDRILTSTDALNHHTDYVYYGCCMLLHFERRISAAAVTLTETENFFDEIKRKHQVKRLHKNSGGNPVGDGISQTDFLFDKNSRLKETTDDRGNKTTNTFDQGDRLTKVVDDLGVTVGNFVDYVLDANGNATTVTSTEYNQRSAALESFVVTHQYDEKDRRKLTTEDPATLNIQTTFKYSSLNDNVVVIDGENKTTRRTFDGLSRLKETKYDEGGLNIVVSQAWDGNSRLLNQTDANNNTTSYEYTNRDQVKKITYADLTTKQMTYDKDDNVKTVLDANGSTVTNTWNAADLMTQRDITRGTGVVGTTQEIYTFDGAYRMTSAENKDGASRISLVSMFYDTLSNVDKTEESYFALAMKTLTANFDGVGNRTSVTYPGGRVISYDLDDINRITTVREGVANIASYFWAGQRVAKRQYPNGPGGNGIRLEAFYDGAKRTTKWYNLDATGNHQGSFEYAYDKANNKKFEKKLQIGVADTGDVYRYDGIYQVTGTKYNVPGADLDPNKTYADYLSWQRQDEFEFDGVGNRKRWIDTPALGTPDDWQYNRPQGGGPYTPDPVNRINRIINATYGQPDTPRTYDANGNLTNDGNQTYQYNYKNELIEARLYPLGQFVQGNNYNCFGLSIMKQSTSTTYFYLDGQRVAEEQDTAGTTLATNVFGASIDEILTVNRSPAHFASTNALGSVVLWTSETGAEQERITYRVWGCPTYLFGGPPPPGTPNESQISPFSFTGREWFGGMGAFYFRARWYWCSTGRFDQRDPCCDDALANLYTYVRNAPPSFTDPFGTNGTEPEEEGSSLIAGAFWIALEIASIPQAWDVTRTAAQDILADRDPTSRYTKPDVPDLLPETQQDNKNVDLLLDFLSGGGRQYRRYGPDDPETTDMRRSPGGRTLRDAFYQGNCQSISQFEYTTEMGILETVILSDPSRWTSDTSWQVGGWMGSAINNGNWTVTFTIKNTASRQSLFLHLPIGNPQVGPTRSIYQTFEWTEDIDKCKCPE